MVVGQLRVHDEAGREDASAMSPPREIDFESHKEELDERGYTVVVGLLARDKALDAATKLLAALGRPGAGRGQLHVREPGSG